MSKKRGVWTSEDLKAAINEIQKNEECGQIVSLREISRIFNIPLTTLRRRIKNQNYSLL